MKKSFSGLFFALSVLSACSPDTDPTPKIAESQREALDKAKAVEATMQQAADDAKQKIDEQSE